MSKDVGISLTDFAKAIVVSYRKGIEDSISYLQNSLTTMDTKAMEEDVIKNLEKQGKVKANW